MLRISCAVVCLLIGCDGTAPTASAGGPDSGAVLDSATSADAGAAKDTSADAGAVPDSTTSADADAGGVVPGAGCAADGTLFNHTISIKMDGTPLIIPATAKRWCKPKDKELTVDFGNQKAPLPEGAFKFRVSLLGTAMQPTDDGFTLANAYFKQIMLFEGGSTAIASFSGKVGTPTTETLTIADGKLTYQFKGMWGNKKSPFLLEVDITDAPLK